MDVKNKATRIQLFSLRSRQMRAFHMSWFAFFLCFFAWFGIAPLMAVVRDELGLTKAQIGNTIIASVAITIFARLLIGWLCDRIGPRLTYTWLLMLGSLPVMGIGLAHSYETFLLFRLGIGAIGGAFVITQYHTSVMFAANCVGTANATSAGWGNLGGGVTQMVMPLVFAAFVSFGLTETSSWRASMVVAGGVCFVTGLAYFFFTTDLPDGNFKELRAKGEIRKGAEVKGTFLEACKDPRSWMLFLIYAACFGIELTINNVAALYYKDYFNLGLKTAGLVAGLFGLMNIFARTTGGIIGDRFGLKWGLKGRVRWLFIALAVEGVALMLFSRMTHLPVAIGTMIIFSLFVQMSEGATYSVVPFINKRALGSVSGIVGAGGNMGAVCAGFLFKGGMKWPDALLVLGICVFCISFVALAVRFKPEAESAAEEEQKKALAERARLAAEAAGKRRRRRPASLPGFADLAGMDLLRMYLGAALAIKGVFFLTTINKLEGSGLESVPTWVAWYVVLAHGVGGAALMLGFVTRLAALINIPVMIGAIVSVHKTTDLFGANLGFQFSLFVAFCLAIFVWKGSGKFSFDQLLRDPDPQEEGSAPEGAAA